MWDKDTKTLHCDFTTYVQPQGTNSASDGFYERCARTITAVTAKEARRQARSQTWQIAATDRCPHHAITRTRLRREDYFPISQRR